MKKAVSKRFKITKNGKVIRRKMAQDHFRSKRSGKQTRHHRKDNTYSTPFAKSINKKTF